MDKALKKMLNLKPHYHINDSIPMESISEDGIIEVKPGIFSRTYKVVDINFGIAKREERGDIVRKWSSLLTSLDSNYDLQVMVFNHRIDIDHMVDELFLPETGDQNDDLREDVNNIISRNLLEGQNAIRRDIYLTLTIPAENMKRAQVNFVAAEHDLISILRTIPGCGAVPLKALPRLNLLHNIFHGGDEKEMQEFEFVNRKKIQSFSLENLYRRGVAAVELIQPESMEYCNDYFVYGKKFGRALTLRGLPPVLTDTFVRDFSNASYNMMFTQNIHAMNNSDALELVKNQRTSAASVLSGVMQKAAQIGSDPALSNPELTANFNDLNDLLNDMTRRGQRLFETKTHVVIFANTKEELDAYCKSFITDCRAKNVQFQIATGLQENAVLSAMPFGIDMTPYKRTMTTEMQSILVPFASQEMLQKGGTVYGVNKITKNIITYDRMSGDSYNMLILGFTGSGKSFFAKKEILTTYLSGKDNDCLIIDPQGEYGKLCEAVGGVEIIIKGAGEHCINPLDISTSYGTNPIAEKVDFLQSMVAEMLAYVPTATQKTAIAISAKACYEEWRLNPIEENVPTLMDFYNALDAYYEANGMLPEVLDAVKAVEYYVAGTDTLFAGKTNVDTSSNFISYNIAELGESIRPLAMMIILDSILNRMSKNKNSGRPTYIYIDELHLLFQNPQTAAWIKALWKTARKFKGCPCGITQDMEDLLSSDIGRSLITNTAFTVLMKQARINVEILANLLQLSARQVEFITDTQAGEGLLCIENSAKCTGGVIPFEDRYPEDSKLYQICQTSNSRRDI